MNGSRRFVILGGGVAGLELAAYLGRHLGRRQQAKILLIDPGFFHVWKPMLHEFAAGTIPEGRNLVSFVAHASRNHFHFWPGSLASVDRSAQEIRLAPIVDAAGQPIVAQRVIQYDTLIAAIGSRANDFGLPGVAEHCRFIDNLREADSFFTLFRTAILRGIDEGTPLHIAIVGGGATGVELAAELHRAIDLTAGYNIGFPRTNLRITLMEAGPRILAAFPEGVSHGAKQALHDLGVDVMTGVDIVGADARGFVRRDGGRVDASIRVWAAGIKAPLATEAFTDLERTKSGQLSVRTNLQSTVDESIFAVGDCSYVGENPLPATAQVARQQARHLSRELVRSAEGKNVRPFRYRNGGAIVTLGDYDGWGTLGRYHFGGGPLHGLVARAGHDLLYREHQMEVYGLLRGLLSWGGDLLDGAVRPQVRLG